MKSLRFFKTEFELLIAYTPSFGNERIEAQLGIEFDDEGNLVKYTEDELPEHLKSIRSLTTHGLTVRIKHIFWFSQADLAEETAEDTLLFCLGRTVDDGSCYKISGRILDIPQDVLIAKNANIGIDFFAVGYEKRTSVLKSISKMLSANESRICIGTQDEDSIPLEEYESLLQNFPTTTRLQHYGESIVESYLQDYLAFKRNYESAFRNMLRRRKAETLPSTAQSLKEIDSLRLDALYEAVGLLENMLDKGERVPEQDWQEGLLGVLPLIFPQYVSVISKAKIRDVLADKDRELDFLLVDASGNVDVLEIKRAFEKRYLLMAGKYRDNYIPARELRGGVFQIEKYIHLLLTWGRAGEKRLTENYREKIPEGMEIKFLNPRGLLIMGHCELDEDERRDFDLIRRQYSKITDIVTYDDLIGRLKRTIVSIENAGMRLT